MARKQTPDGRRITICVKVSEPEAAAIDAACGSLTRSAWGRMALLAAAGPPTPARMTRQPPGHAEGTEPAAAPDPAPRPARARHRCPIKGWCAECGEWKGKKPG